ncbi:MAG: type II CAAX prenyl endopeptidase Rce1 family protein [Candidatus Heimdallarchaeota archaeon]
MSEIEQLDPLNRSLGKYLMITFAFSWTFWLPSLLATYSIIPLSPFYNLLLIIGSFGPLVAGFSLTIKEGGIEGGIELWKKGFHCNKKSFFLISISLIPLLCIISLLLASISDEGALLLYFRLYDFRQGYILTEMFVLFLFTGPIQEEFGWRGYALCYLQSKMNAFEASLILGGIWSVWHFPLFLINETAYFGQNFYGFTVYLLALSILFTWLNNNTNGSILVAILFHTSINVTSSLFLQRISPLGSIYFIILLDVVMIAIIIIFGKDTLKWNDKKAKSSIKII